MKNVFFKILGGVVCSLALGLASASAALFISYSGVPQTITDGSSVGITSIATVSGAGTLAGSGDNVSVTLNLSGGNMGDLVAYLSYNGTTVQLLNRPGTGGNLSSLGYTGNGSFTFNGTLSDGNSTSVDSYGGGNVASGVNYNASGGATAFQAYNGMSVDGNWTLFFADMSGGDGANTTTLNGWSLNITAVPEPVNVAMATFATIVLFAGGGRSYRRHVSSPKSIG